MLLLAGPRHAAAQGAPQDAGVCDPAAVTVCDRSAVQPPAPASDPRRMPASRAQARSPVLRFYWGVGCPHCEAATPFVRSLERSGGVSIDRIEVRQSAVGRERFLAEAGRLGIAAPGVPLFVLGDRYVIGFQRGATESQLHAMVREATSGRAASRKEGVRRIHLPLIGGIDPSAWSLATLALLVGLVDGINPCAMYVLVALLGILLRVRSRRRIVLFGGIFVLTSGVVYFAFMAAWLNLFRLTGFARSITVVLGAVLIVMGMINLKELLWFKKGVSLTVPDRAKPALFRRMRTVASAASLPAALVGITTLAFLVNLVELGCTLGLPAVFTRILSLRRDVTAAGRYGYLVLYNLAYIVPLAVIVMVYAATLSRITLTERGAKGLKFVSGVLLVVFGALFVAAPEVLQ